MVSPYLTKIIYETQSSNPSGKVYCFYHGRHCWREDSCIIKQDKTSAERRKVSIAANSLSSRPGMGVKNTAYAKDLFEGSISFD